MTKLPVTLALDSSANACSAAIIGYDEQILASKCVLMERGHAEAIVPMVDEIITAAKIDFHEIQRLAFCSGPGNFAGLRVCQAAAKGYAIAMGAELLGVSTFDIFGHLEDQEAIIALDGRRSEVFVRENKPDAKPKRFHIDEIAQNSDYFDGFTQIVGPFADVVAQNLAKDDIRAKQCSPVLDIEVLAKLAQKSDINTTHTQLQYLREADAKPGVGFAVARV